VRWRIRCSGHATPVDAAGAPEAGALRQLLVEILVEQLLDLAFDVSDSLKPSGTNMFDGLVLEQIMRRPRS